MPTLATQVLLQKIESLPAEKISEVEDFVDFLRSKLLSKMTLPAHQFDFPVDQDSPWSEAISLHREDMYGDDGR